MNNCTERAEHFLGTVRPISYKVKNQFRIRMCGVRQGFTLQTTGAKISTFIYN